MGQRIHVEMFDDLDPELEATFTDEIWWKGKLMVIDLSEANHEKLMELLKPYVEVARKKGSGDSTVATPTVKVSRTVEQQRATEERMKIRKWGRRNGWPTLGSNGVIPALVVEEFHKYEGKDKPQPEMGDPDPVPTYFEFTDYPDEEQVAIKEWVLSIGLKWPHQKTARNRIALEAWGDHNETLAKEIMGDYVP